MRRMEKWILDCAKGARDWTFDVLEGCLYVASDYERTSVAVWVMKEYGVRDSWIKVVSVPYLGGPNEYWQSTSVCLSRNGEILLILGLPLVLYSPKSSTFRIRSPEPESKPDIGLHDMYEDDGSPHLPMPPHSLAGPRASVPFSSDQFILQDIIPLKSSSSTPFHGLDGMSLGTSFENLSQPGSRCPGITLTQE
ncbi:hypothetical protein ACH5RR_031744 [Cinchona calisaya]|uniref:Uncharacterized protein n=1 Tax=Cinchona calisaya TaxID=153742 RepID=A0ABD2YJ55_9GENT